MRAALENCCEQPPHEQWVPLFKIQVFFSCVSFSIIVPSLANYLRRMGAEEWVLGPNTQGPDAMARVTLHMKAFRRRMTWVYINEQRDRTITMNGLGDKGFATRFVIQRTEDDRTEMVMASYLNPPPWPLKKYYFETVVPEWKRCWAETLDNLDAAATR